MSVLKTAVTRAFVRGATSPATYGDLQNGATAAYKGDMRAVAAHVSNILSRSTPGTSGKR